MDKRFRLKEQLSISSLSVQRLDFNNTHHFDSRIRKIHNSIGYIEKGSVEFTMLSETITAKEGDLIFVPEGLRYVSHWTGNPEIKCYNVHFLMPKRTMSMWRSMKLQRIENAPVDQIHGLILRMYECAQKGDVEHLEGFSLFYQMLSLVLPYMETNPMQNLPETLQTAIAFIEANYTTVTSVREIATACFVSESRLYHLFKEHLNTSPISYLNYIRIYAAMELLANPDLSIQQIADQLNFHSEYYFRKTFQKVTGELPSKLRKML
jgi:AraC-like DNA-binding protein